MDPLAAGSGRSRRSVGAGRRGDGPPFEFPWSCARAPSGASGCQGAVASVSRAVMPCANGKLVGVEGV